MIRATERDTPKYKLEKIKLLIEEGNYRITSSAKTGAELEFGLEKDDILQVVKNLTEKDFKVSQKITTGRGWYDVYIKKIKKVLAYIKITINEKVELIIVSFKQK